MAKPRTLSDSEVIDLRDHSGEPDPAAGAADGARAAGRRAKAQRAQAILSPLRSDAASDTDHRLAREMWLSQFSLATQPGGVPPARVALLQALLDVHLHGPDLTTMVAGDREDVRRWVAILEAVAGAHQLARQGSFRSAIRAAAKLANALPPAHRELAALFLLHVAAEGATFPVEFQDAVAAAEWLDPPTIAPDTIVDGVIRTCLAYPHSPPRPTAISFGLPVTLDVLAGATYPGLSRHDMWALQSVLSELPDAGEQLLRAAPRLHPQDRRQVRKLVEPRAVRRRVRLRWR